MTAHAETVGHAPYPELHRYGLRLFLASEAFLFFVMFSARFYLLGFDKPEELNILLGLGLTAILMTASFFAHEATKAANAGDIKTLQTKLLITIGLGALFIGIVAYEWGAGFSEFPIGTPYGSMFYLITGVHVLHLFIGMVILGSLVIQAKKGTITANTTWKVHGGITYWQFVDSIWLTVFIVLYVL